MTGFLHPIWLRLCHRADDAEELRGCPSDALPRRSGKFGQLFRVVGCCFDEREGRSSSGEIVAYTNSLFVDRWCALTGVVVNSFKTNPRPCRALHKARRSCRDWLTLPIGGRLSSVLSGVAGG